MVGRLSPSARSYPATLSLTLVDSSLCVFGVLKVYQRVGLEDMSTLTSYKQWGKTYGLEFVEFDDQTNNLVMHYDSVRAKLTLLIVCSTQSIYVVICNGRAHAPRSGYTCLKAQMSDYNDCLTLACPSMGRFCSSILL